MRYAVLVFLGARFTRKEGRELLVKVNEVLGVFSSFEFVLYIGCVEANLDNMSYVTYSLENINIGPTTKDVRQFPR